MRRWLTGLTALALATAPLSADGTPGMPVSVPFEMLQKGRLFSGHIAIQVKVNGRGPYRLIFDTGAPMILLSNKVAKEAGLFGAEDKRPAGPALLLMPGQVRLSKLEVGK